MNKPTFPFDLLLRPNAYASKLGPFSFGPQSPRYSWCVVRFLAHPSSEQQLQPELYLAGGGNRTRDPTGITLIGSARSEDRVVGQTKVGAIQEIEELGPKIHFQSLTHRNHFGQREVQVRKARRNQGVPAYIAVKTGGGKRKDAGIKIFVRPSQNWILASPQQQIRTI